MALGGVTTENLQRNGDTATATWMYRVGGVT
jgi:hypothetical protein